MSQKQIPGPGSNETDAIDTLSLSIIPLSNNSLKNAKLVKNSRMETAVELHSSALSGSLQVSPKDIAKSIPMSLQDFEIINKLAELESYDVYSLRTNLKKMGVDVMPTDALELSDDMKAVLQEFTAEFTKPMIEKIFGSGEDIAAQGGLQKLLQDPNPQKVLENLRTITLKTGIATEDIPKFLEDYTETLTSVAYYQHTYEHIRGSIERFLFWVHEILQHKEAGLSPTTLRACKKAEEIMRFLASSLGDRIDKFHSYFKLFWIDINQNTFSQLQRQIEDNHAAMGAVLCGLLVKMRLWEKQFPNNNIGGPALRSKFVVTDLEPGLEQLFELENIAREKLGMSTVRF